MSSQNNPFFTVADQNCKQYSRLGGINISPSDYFLWLFLLSLSALQWQPTAIRWSQQPSHPLLLTGFTPHMHHPHHLCTCSSAEFPFIPPACKVTKASLCDTQQSSVLTMCPKLCNFDLDHRGHNLAWEKRKFLVWSYPQQVFSFREWHNLFIQ